MNPFVQNIKLSVIKVNEHITVYRRSKLSSSKVLTNDFYYFDPTHKSSVFHTPGFKTMVFNQLRVAGRELLMYLILSLPKEKDYIDLEHKIVCEAMGVTRATVHSGIKQLTEVGLIVRRDHKTYWINPMYMYNGSRVEYFKKLEQEYSEEKFIIIAEQ